MSQTKGAAVSNLVEFPIADKPITESDVDKLQSEAFRDLKARFAISTAWVKSRTT